MILTTSVISIRMDEELKKQFEKIVNELGLNMTTAITAFAKTVVRQEGIPFELSAKKDSFYSPADIAALKESIEQHKRGDVITFDSVEGLATAAASKKTFKQIKKEQERNAR